MQYIVMITIIFIKSNLIWYQILDVITSERVRSVDERARLTETNCKETYADVECEVYRQQWFCKQTISLNKTTSCMCVFVACVNLFVQGWKAVGDRKPEGHKETVLVHHHVSFLVTLSSNLWWGAVSLPH